MVEIEIESPVGWPNYMLRGEDEDQAKEAASEFRRALDYINHLPYYMTFSNAQAEFFKKEIEDKYHIEILFTELNKLISLGPVNSFEIEY